MCVLMCNFVSYFVCVILRIFVFLCDILLPSGVINDDNSSPAGSWAYTRINGKNRTAFALILTESSNHLWRYADLAK